MNANNPRLKEYLHHVVQAIDNINQDMELLDYETFKGNETIQRSVILSFIVIGEASTKVLQRYPDFVSNHNHIPWQAMKGMRNHLAHGYFSINTQVLWNTVQTELPRLKQQMSDLISTL